jgi:hypothetical protein
MAGVNRLVRSMVRRLGGNRLDKDVGALRRRAMEKPAEETKNMAKLARKERKVGCCVLCVRSLAAAHLHSA